MSSLKNLHHSDCTFVFFEGLGDSVTFLFRGTGDFKSFVLGVAEKAYESFAHGDGNEARQGFEFHGRPLTQEKFGRVVIDGYLPSVSIYAFSNENLSTGVLYGILFHVTVSLKISDDRDPIEASYLVDADKYKTLPDSIWRAYQRLLVLEEDLEDKVAVDSD